MPGSARMYPETDVPDMELDKEILDYEGSDLPELYDKKLARIKNKWNIEENKIEEILTQFNEGEFDELLDLGIKSTSIYSLVFELPKEVKKREKLESINLSFNLIKEILKADLGKNVLYNLHINLYKDGINDIDNLDKYLDKKGLKIEEIDTTKIEEDLKKIVDENSGAPMGALMGLAMKHFKGQVEGKVISEILRKLM